MNSTGGRMNVSLLHQFQLERSRFGSLETHADRYVVQAALHYVVLHVFAQMTTTVIMTIAAMTPQMNDLFSDMLETLFANRNEVSVQLVRQNGQQLEEQRQEEAMPYAYRKKKGRKVCNLLLVDSYEALSATSLAANNGIHDGMEFYFIFLKSSESWNPNEMQRILSYCLANYWLHCNIMVQTLNMEVVVYSYFPYTPTHCQEAQPMLINRFDGVRMVNEIMFPDKLVNLHGCALTLLTWNMPPYVILRLNADGTWNAQGFELFYVRSVAEKLNFTLKIVNLTLHDDITVTDEQLEPVKMLLQRKANISVGYFRKTHERTQLLTASLTSYYTPLVAVMLRARNRYSTLEILTFPFQLPVWLLLCASAGLYFLPQLMQHWFLRRRSTAYIVELLLGVPIAARLPEQLMHRFVYLIWLFGTIPLRAIYQALLFHLIRLQLFRAGPSSFVSLITSGYKAWTSLYTLRLLEGLLQETCGPQSQHRHLFEAFNATQELQILTRLANVAPTEPAIYAIAAADVTQLYMRHYHLAETFQILPEYVNVQQIAMHMPKHSYLVDKFDDVLCMLTNAGLDVAWHRWTFGTSALGDVTQQTPEQNTHSGYVGAKELVGIFWIMGVMYVLATLVLFVEYLAQHCCRRRLIAICQSLIIWRPGGGSGSGLR